MLGLSEVTRMLPLNAQFSRASKLIMMCQVALCREREQPPPGLSRGREEQGSWYREVTCGTELILGRGLSLSQKD